MNKGKRNGKKSTSSSTGIYLKQVIWGLKDKLGFGEGLDNYGEASQFEALEQRVLLSASPLDLHDFSQKDQTDAAQMLNNSNLAIYMDANTAEAENVAETQLPAGEFKAMSETLSPIVRSGGVITPFSADQPDVTIIHTGGANIKVGDTITITVVASDPNGLDIKACSLSVHGEVLELDASNSAEFTFKEPGLYVIAAVARNANNVNGSATLSIRVLAEGQDIERPVVNIGHNGSSTMNVGQSIEFTVTATDNVGVTEQTFSINGTEYILGADGKFQYEFTAAGTYKIVATAKDAAGNTGKHEVTITVLDAADTEAPIVNVTHTGSSGIYVNQEVVFTITSSDNVGVTGTSMTINGQDVAVDASGIVRYTFTSAGSYTIVVSARDAAGNVGKWERTVTVVEQSIPSHSVTLTHDAGSSLTVTSGQTVNFTMTINGSAEILTRSLMVGVETVSLDSAGNGSFKFTTPGSYNVTAIAIDIQGRVATSSVTITVVGSSIDIEAPVVTLEHNIAGEIFAGQSVKFTVKATDNVGVTNRTLTINGIEVALDSEYSVNYTFTQAGTYVIIGNAYDAANNVGMQTITLTVKVNGSDTESPTVDISHNAVGGIKVGQKVDFAITATDNVGIKDVTLLIGGQKVELDASYNGSYTFTQAGTYSIAVIATDDAGNIGTKTMVVTVSAQNTDSEAPVITIVHDGNNIIRSGDEVNFTVNMVDNVGIDSYEFFINGQSATLDANFQTTYTFGAPGVYTFMVIARDKAGNVGTQTLVLTVAAPQDIEAPVVTVGHDGPAIINPGQEVKFTVGATDNVGVKDVYLLINGQSVAVNASGEAMYTFSSPGIYAITAMAIDLSGNVGYATMVVQVVSNADTQPPVVSIEHDGGTNLEAGQKVTITVGAVDNVGVVGRELTVNGQTIVLDSEFKAEFTFGAAGYYVIHATARDDAGNIGVQTMTVYVSEPRDTEAPNVNITHNGSAQIVVGDTVEFTITATDNVGVDTLVVTFNGQTVTLVDGKFSHDFTAPGKYTIFVSARDAAGNVSTQTLELTVIHGDTEAPVVTITPGSNSIWTGDTVEFTVNATDNSGTISSLVVKVNGVDVTLVDGKFSYNFAAAGKHVIVATAVDPAGNSATTTLELNIVDKDNEPPVISIIHNGQGSIYVGDTVSFEVTATDNSGVAPTVVVDVNGQPVTLVDGKFDYQFSASGTYVVTVIATDGQGNIATSVVEITVTARDSEAPVVEISRPTSPVWTGDTIDFTVTATDNVGVDSLVVTVNGQTVSLTGGVFSYSFAAAGKYTIIATAKDAQGNIGIATLELNVADKDTEAPVVEFIYGGGEVVAGQSTDFVVKATDNVGVTRLIVTVNGANGSVTIPVGLDGKFSYTFAAPGYYAITAMAIDAQGNIGSSNLIVSVVAQDTEDPVVSIVRNQDRVIVGKTIDFTVTATDNVGVDDLTVAVYRSGQPGDFVTLDAYNHFSYVFAEAGTYVITATARDAQGNIGVANMVVTVLAADTEPPVVTIDKDSGTVWTGDTVEFTVTATDNVGVDSLVVKVNDVEVTLVDGKFSYNFASAGKYVIVATATDVQGNKGSYTLELHIVNRDNEAPVVTITRPSGDIFLGDTVEFTVTATDNSGVIDSLVVTVNDVEVTLADGKFSYEFSTAGKYVIVATATDGQGNKSSSVLEIYIDSKDTEAPTVDITKNVDAVFTGNTVEFTVDARDNVGVDRLIVTVNSAGGSEVITVGADGKFSYKFSAAGVYVISATAIDAAGNTGSANMMITVIDQDSEAPVVTIDYEADRIIVGDTVGFTIKATDNVAVTNLTVKVNGQTVTLVGDKLAYNFSTSGKYTIVAEATDAQGNKGAKTVELTVIAKDMDPPRVTISPDSDNILVGDTVNFDIEAIDNVGVESLVVTVNGTTMKLVDGKFSYKFAKDGKYVIIATATDAQKNVGTATLELDIVTKDDVPPSVDISYQGEVWTGETVTFTVKATDNVGIKSLVVKVNNKTVTLVDGKFDYKFSTSGKYVIVATAEDFQGNKTEARLEVTAAVKDNEAPKVDITYPAGNIYTNDTVIFTVKATDNVGVDKLVVTVNGKEVKLTNGKFSYKFATAGRYEIKAEATDAAGNVGFMTIIYENIAVRDTEKPVVSITHNAGSSVLTGQKVEFTVKATDNIGVDTLVVTVNGKDVTLVNGKFSETFLTAGTYNVVATAKDAAGNIGIGSVKVTVVKDCSAPVVSLTHSGGSLNTIWVDTGLIFRVSATDNVGVTGMSLSINGTEYKLSPEGTFSYKFTQTGTFNVVAQAWDATGNIGTKSVKITVSKDTTAPVVDLSHNGGSVIYAGKTVDFAIHATDNRGVTGYGLTINGEEVDLSITGRGSYKFTAAGTYKVVASARDAAGNVGTYTCTIIVSKKSTKPTVNVGHDGGSTIYTGEKLEFTVTATDNIGVEGMSLTIAGKDVTLNAEGKATYSFSVAGTYTVIAKAWDASGNIGSKTITVTITEKDTQAPDVKVIHNGNGGILAGQKITFTVTATDNVGVTGRELEIDGVTIGLTPGGMGTYTFPAAGKYTVIARARDAAGNIGTTMVNLTVLNSADEEAPTVYIVHDAQSQIYVGQTVTFTVTASDNVGVAWLEMSINDVPMEFDSQGRVRYEFKTPGTYRIVAIATDDAGNIGTKEIILEVL